MKLRELQVKITNEPDFKEAREEVRRDLAFQIGHIIENLRISLGLSQSQFAERIGLQQPAVARLEKGGKVVPSLPMLQKIADATDCELALPSFVSLRTPSTQSDSRTETQTGVLSPFPGILNGLQSKSFAGQSLLYIVN